MSLDNEDWKMWDEEGEDPTEEELATEESDEYDSETRHLV